MNRLIPNVVSSFALALLVTSQATALTVPYEEDFASDSANWLNFNSSAVLTHEASGGPDGGSYASGTFNFVNSAFGDQGPVIHRGTTTPFGPSSEGNFFGDWLTGDVRNFSAWVRHDAPTPLTYFARFADPNNSPGASAVRFSPVFPNTWTQLEFSISPDSPNFVTFEGQSFEAVFDNIGRVQVGVSIPEALAGVDQQITFDLDKVAIAVPEPATLFLLSSALVIGLGCRRKPWC